MTPWSEAGRAAFPSLPPLCSARSRLGLEMVSQCKSECFESCITVTGRLDDLLDELRDMLPFPSQSMPPPPPQNCPGDLPGHDISSSPGADSTLDPVPCRKIGCAYAREFVAFHMLTAEVEDSFKLAARVDLFLKRRGQQAHAST